MVKPNIIVTYPIHLDYPLWRYNMVKYQDYFNSLVIVLSNHHMGVDYSNFIRVQLPFANFIEAKGKDPDWRNGTVNEGLDLLPLDGHVLFLEQDFLFTEGFLEKVLSDWHDVIYFTEGKRIHPAFALVKRELIDKTSRDFSAYPDTYGDHFSKFFSELVLGKNITELGGIDRENYFHMNGLSQEYMNFRNSQPFYNKDNFTYYNNECRYLPIENHPEFYSLEWQIAAKFGAPKESFLERFFPREHTNR